MVVADCPVRQEWEGVTVYSVGTGTLRLECAKRWHYVGVSGEALAHLRSVDQFEDLLVSIGTSPHTVTRLDLSVDVGCDFPAFLGGLDSKYPDRRVALTRKRQKATVMLEPRDSDGQLTGSYYVGARTSTVTLVVYDKQAEILKKYGGHLPPTTRVELRLSREVGATLRDSVMPVSLFHHYVPEDIVPRPEGVSAWESHAEPWVPDRAPVPLDYAVLKRRIENSPEFACLVDLAVRLGPEGETLLLGAVKRAYARAGSTALSAASIGAAASR